MLHEKGFRPSAEQQFRSRSRKHEPRVYRLEERLGERHVVQMPLSGESRARSRTTAEEEADAIRQRVADKVEVIARETRALYQQRLDKVLVNGIFDEKTNYTRMQSMYKSALLERINWQQLEREATSEIRAGRPLQGVASMTPVGNLGAKLDRLLQNKAAHGLEPPTQQRIIKRQSFAQVDRLEREGERKGEDARVD